MNEKLFDELVESIQEAGAILRGEKQPSRIFKYDDTAIIDNRYAAKNVVSINVISSDYAPCFC